MRRDLQLFAGASAAAAIVFATQGDFYGSGDTAPDAPPPPVTPANASEPAPPPTPDRAPELATITRLTAELHDRETDIGRLQVSLAPRAVELDRVPVALAVLKKAGGPAAVLPEREHAPTGVAPVPTPDVPWTDIYFEGASAALAPGGRLGRRQPAPSPPAGHDDRRASARQVARTRSRARSAYARRLGGCPMSNQ